MKICTWNINSIRIRMNLLSHLSQTYKPDIICIQETKVVDDDFPLEAIKKIGYKHVVYIGQKSYHGVAILSKFPIEDSFVLDFIPGEKRHIAISTQGFEVHNFYIPAGGDIPDISLNKKFYDKICFIQNMTSWVLKERCNAKKLIFLGDFNVAPHENDVWSSKQLRNVVSHTDIERKHIINLQNTINFIDTGRYFVNSSDKLYTWWSYRNRDWKKSNRGRRLDHIWVSNDLKESLLSIYVADLMRSMDKPSDHVPFFLEMK